MKTQRASRKLSWLDWMRLAGRKAWKCPWLGWRRDSEGVASQVPMDHGDALPFRAPQPPSMDARERSLLLSLAKRSIEEAVNSENVSNLNTHGLSARLLQPKGCFVTLCKQGQLRGCLGQVFPHTALYNAVRHNARGAATRDPRFPRVHPEELRLIEIEISILTEPEPLSFDSPEELLSQLSPCRDGVLLQIGHHLATFLPQVWGSLPDKVAFLDSLSRKARCEPDAWRHTGVCVSIYQVESIKETPFG